MNRISDRVAPLRIRRPAALAVLGAALSLVAMRSPEVAPAATEPAPMAAVAMAPPAEAGTDTAKPGAAESAVAALSAHVARMSDPGALRTAIAAYYAYRADNPGAVKKPYLYYVDLGLDNRTPRGYVFDMDGLTLVEGPFTVAHGRGSGARNGVPRAFSNRSGSNSSSLGLYLAQETYTFSGKTADRRYSSVGLRMKGESGEFNSAARARGIVAHGAPYVTRSEAGRSEGCPAMELARANRLLPKIANGGVVFIYSPHDTRWLQHDPWLARAAS